MPLLSSYLDVQKDDDDDSIEESDDEEDSSSFVEDDNDNDNDCDIWGLFRCIFPPEVSDDDRLVLIFVVLRK